MKKENSESNQKHVKFEADAKDEEHKIKTEEDVLGKLVKKYLDVHKDDPIKDRVKYEEKKVKHETKVEEQIRPRPILKPNTNPNGPQMMYQNQPYPPYPYQQQYPQRMQMPPYPQMASQMMPVGGNYPYYVPNMPQM